jgi:hypothetical protein
LYSDIEFVEILQVTWQLQNAGFRNQH